MNDNLNIQTLTLTELRDLSAHAFTRHTLTPEDFDHIFRQCDALWLHSGDPKAPHAELTSGKCSNGFVDVLRVLRYTNLCSILAEQLLDQLIGAMHQTVSMADKQIPYFEWVVGSDHAGATLSFALAQLVGAQHDFTEKGPDKTQVWKRFDIEQQEPILQVEELVTTTGTLQAVRDGLRRGHAHPLRFFPAVLTLVHRSKVYEFEGSPIIYLRHYDIETWAPDTCPLCAQGSKRLRPKQNWAELTGKL
ncbi:MAG: orotate phosphoribosyltransferase [Parcubacteria group bacterium ADurb.Bin192]|nr:MAG: orotate phosphoribosyltransferase [Parcubacteria group bacterium ADurb.Bin192]